MKKLFFISDAHLGAQDTEQEQLKSDRLVSWLRFIGQQDGDLVICGDLFDFWFEYRRVIPRLHFPVLAELALFTSSGRSVHYLTGNHDFWMGSFMTEQLGLCLHEGEWTVQHGGYRIYLHHGDGLKKRDAAYRLLKKILRHSWSISLYRLLHPDLGVPLALFFSRLSRNVTREITDLDSRRFASRKIDDGFELVVLGHTHWPALQKYRGGWYLNPGNWMDAFTYAVLEPDGPRLYSWNGREGCPIPPPPEPPANSTA